MIDENNCKRIRDDAYIACDALESIIEASPYIHEDYLREKLDVVRKCIAFMQHYETKDLESPSERSLSYD